MRECGEFVCENDKKKSRCGVNIAVYLTTVTNFALTAKYIFMLATLCRLKSNK